MNEQPPDAPRLPHRWLLPASLPLWLLSTLAPGGQSGLILSLFPAWAGVGVALHATVGIVVEVLARAKRPRRTAFALVAAAIGIGGALALSEGLLRLREDHLPRRVLRRLGAPPFRLSESATCVYDGPWGFRGKPNLVLPPGPAEPELVRGGIYREHPQAEPTEQVGLTFDADGFRNPPGVERADVVVVGDSFAFGWNLPREASWPALLEAKIGKPTYSLGFNAYGPSQGLEALKAFGLRRQPKTVVWTVFLGNDLDDEVFYRRRINAGPVTTPPPIVLTGSRLAATLGWAAEHLPLALWRHPGSPRDAPVGTVGGKPTVLGFAAGALRRLAKPIDAWRKHPGVPLLVDVLTKARDLCAPNGVRLVVVLIPTKESLLYPLADRSARHAALLAALPAEVAAVQAKRPGQAGLDLLDERLLANASDQHQVVREALLRLQLPLVDLRASLLADYQAGRPPYFALDSHWNRRGQQTCAAAVAEAVAK